jgi:acyl-CoA oxidase
VNPFHSSDRAWPREAPGLLAFLPLVHSAWADGVLSDDELRALRGRLGTLGWLREEDAAAVRSWLDPRSPPTPDELSALGDRMRLAWEREDLPLPRSLTDLGLALSRAAGGGDAWEDTSAIRDLRDLEQALGVAGPEAVRRALGAKLADGGRRAPGGLRFDARALNAYLDRDRRGIRSEVLGLLAEKQLRIPPELPRSEYREQVLSAVRAIAERGFGVVGYPQAYGGSGDPAAGVAVFETLAYGDLSVLVKYGVQFGLFGGSVLQLGSTRHHETHLRAIGSLDLPGCYAMTETGHGSNVRDLETTATYVHETDELIVRTPNDDAAKDWIGNAALHGRLATVFARLIVAGVDHGVHAVLVPLRDSDGRILEDVRIEDRGAKEGLNGIDNGRIWFDGVRVPRVNLLDRFASIDDEGRYVSDIASPGRRFFTMLGTLVTGRISIAAASVSAVKTGLTIAVRYTERRRQFGPEGGPEVPLLDYLAMQRTLLPRLATTYGLHFAVRDLLDRIREPHEPVDPELEVRAAGLKALASRHCVDTLQACREACGGQGYLAANRFAALKADTDVFTTFEGANDVLLQLVAKGLLSRFRHEMGDLQFWGTLRWLAERAGASVASHNPLFTRRTDPEHLRDPAFHLAALTYREDRLLRSAATRLKARLDDGVDSFQAMNECQDHLLELARAHVDRIVLEAFQEGVARAPSPGLADVLMSLCAIHGLSTLEESRAWYLESGFMEPAKSRAVRAEVNALCAELRGCARLLVDAFGIPDELLAAPAALD